MITEINGSVLTEALREHADTKLQQEIREWLIYAAPKDVTEIFTKYVKKMEEKRDLQLAIQAKFQREQEALARMFMWLGYAVAIGVVIFAGSAIYDIVTFPGRCLR